MPAAYADMPSHADADICWQGLHRPMSSFAKAVLMAFGAKDLLLGSRKDLVIHTEINFFLVATTLLVIIHQAVDISSRAVLGLPAKFPLGLVR